MPVVSHCGSFNSLSWPVAWADLPPFTCPKSCLTTSPKCSMVHQKIQQLRGRQPDQSISLHCVESSLTSDLNFQRTAEHMCQSRYLRLSYVLLKVVSGSLLILEAPRWSSCSSHAKLHADLLACLYKKGHPRFDILIHHITYFLSQFCVRI